MTDIRVLVWRTSEATGEPEVEVKVPASLAKWVPRMMAFVPKKSKVEMWGEGVDFGALFGNIEQMIEEAAATGVKELVDVKAKEAHIKVLVD